MHAFNTHTCDIEEDFCDNESLAKNSLTVAVPFEAPAVAVDGEACIISAGDLVCCPNNFPGGNRFELRLKSVNKHSTRDVYFHFIPLT